MSFPETKTVELDEDAWRAKVDVDSAIEGSITVTTLEKIVWSMANGDTTGL